MNIPDHLIAIGLISGSLFYFTSTWLTWRAGIQRGILMEKAAKDKAYRPRADVDALQKAYAAELREKAMRKRYQAPSRLPMPPGLSRDPGQHTILTTTNTDGTARLTETTPKQP